MVTLTTWGKIPNALLVDKHVTSVMGKRSKKHNVNTVETEQKEFAFIVKDDDVSEKLTCCVGGVELKMLT